jgi:hypothetical protein
MRILQADMSRPIRSSDLSSSAYEEPFILRPKRSRWLMLWWLALHLVVSLGVIALGLGALATCFAAAALGAHGVLRAPRRTAVLLRRRDGTWALPDAGLDRLRLGRGTRYGSLWMELVLVADSPNRKRKTAILLLRDQVDAESWRRLQAQLRRRGT